MAFNFKRVFSSLGTPKIATKPTKVVGIDFGSSSIKVVELESKDGAVSLSTYGELQLGPYADSALGAGVKLPLNKKIEAIVDVLRESGVSAKDGVFAIPLADSFVTIVSLEASADEDISPRVNVEARKYIPVPITDVALEWSELPAVDPKKNLSREVLLAAIQNKSLGDINSILDTINLSSKPAEIELFCSMRAVTEVDDTSIAVIDLGASITKMYIFEKGFVRRLHRSHSGGVQATNNIASTLAVSFDVAENLKRNYNPADAQAQIIHQGIEKALSRGFDECKRVLREHEVRTGEAVGRIVLTGGGANYAGIIPYASYLLDREVVTANPFKKIMFPAFLEDTLIEIAPGFTVALGAALRQFEV
jgi:type IV pilus assembly protein PilM